MIEIYNKNIILIYNLNLFLIFMCWTRA